MTKKVLALGFGLGLFAAFSFLAIAQEQATNSEQWWQKLSIHAQAEAILQGLYNSDDAIKKQREIGLSTTTGEGDILDATYSSELKLTAEFLPEIKAHWVLELGEGRGVDQLLTQTAFFNYDAYNTSQNLSTDELYLEARSRYVSFLFGKIDWVNQFDTNLVAGNEVSQFLSRAFVVNSTIFGPSGYLNRNQANNQNTLAMILIFKPSENLSAKYGVFENDGDLNKIDGKDMVHFGAIEASWAIDNNPGNLRFYYVENDGFKNEFPDNQLVRKTIASSGVNADQAIGSARIFFRYGEVINGNAGEFYSPYVPNMPVPDWHFSGGFNFSDLPLGGTIAIAYGFNHLPAEWQDRIENMGQDPAKGENVAELYYRMELNQILSITPDVIYIQCPAGVKNAEAVFAYGLRTVLEF